jgi:hypothetical protein
MNIGINLSWALSVIIAAGISQSLSLVNMSYGHKQLDGRYCVVCSHKIYDKMGYCDECDDHYPKSHLYVNAVDKTTLCKGCIGRLHFEKEEDY